MTQRREFERLNVNLPVTVNLVHGHYHDLESWIGSVRNVSRGGMRIGLPLHVSNLQTEILHYFVVLPKPFREICGDGRIRWVYWDHLRRMTDVGIEFTDIDETHLHELETILNECAESHPTHG